LRFISACEDILAGAGGSKGVLYQLDWAIMAGLKMGFPQEFF